jgi:hypothetical protein
VHLPEEILEIGRLSYSSIGQGQLCVLAKTFSEEWINEEFDAIKAFGIPRVVSLLGGTEADAVGLADENQHCQNRGINFLQYELPVRGNRTHTDTFLALIEFLHNELVEGKNTDVYRRGGIGRTGIVATAI